VLGPLALVVLAAAVLAAIRQPAPFALGLEELCEIA
jgi:hypothetical protein